MSTRKHGIDFSNYIHRLSSKISPEVGCVLLSTLLPLGSELVEVMTSSERKLFSAFKEYFSCLVLLAGSNKDNGHLILAKVVCYCVCVHM